MFIFLVIVSCFLSIVLRMSSHPKNRDDDADHGSDHRENPGPHHNFAFWPTERLKMMMKRRRQKNLTMKKFLAGELNDHTARLQKIHKNYQKKHQR